MRAHSRICGGSALLRMVVVGTAPDGKRPRVSQPRIRVVVSFPPGGGTDTNARMYRELSEPLSVP